MSRRQTWIALISVGVFAFVGGSVATAAVLLGPLHGPLLSARATPTPSPTPSTSAVPSPSPASAPAPAPRFDASWAFDTSAAGFLMFGGHSVFPVPLNDTWIWDGAHWSLQAASSVAPLPRFSAPMVYDPVRKVMVLHAGDSGAEFNWPNDTWTWDGQNWKLMSPNFAPPAGNGAYGGYELMVWDDALKVVLDFDVLQDSSVQTWAWDGANWSHLAVANSPFTYKIFPRQAAYSAARNSVVLFGSSQGSPATWTFDGTAFTQMATSSGTGSSTFYMAPDDANSNIVVFGSTGDTWLWNGTKWNAQNPVHSPSAREGSGMAYDPVHHVVVLIGGRSNNQPLGDIWNWDGSDWTKVS